MNRAHLAVSLLVTLATATAAQATFEVRYETERAGMQLSSATFSTGGVETFNSRSSGSGFTTDFGTNGAISGIYSSVNPGGTVQINNADQYGGANGSGKYIASFASTPYQLALSSSAGGVNYFGYWLSALDAGNTLSFYSGGNLLFTFSAADAQAAVYNSPNSSSYYGNPNSPYSGNNGNEPYVFLNFFNDGGTFDKVVFSESPNFSGGYESDNHTVGFYTSKGTGTVVPLVSSVTSAVPEPTSWAMMVGGFGVIGLALRRRRSISRPSRQLT